MKTSIKTVIAVVFVLIIMFCSAWLAQSFFKDARLDVTYEKIYTISQGTKNILAKLNQPINIKLFYARTAALKGPDQIKFFNDYYEFVSSLLKEYVKAGSGMIKLEIIDPRPYSDEEAEALRYGLRKFPISAEENFFFGLAVKTQFGVTKTLEFFSPQRERFVEYDISSLIDSAISRRKSKLGVMSSLSITGSNMSPYMLQMMRMQGQQPAMPWGIIEQLKQKYEIVKIAADVEKIEGVDMLLVVHPKKLPEKTLFAIDQFVIKGGKAVICVDPHCVADRPNSRQMQMMQTLPSQASELNKLMTNWGITMPADFFAADRYLALPIQVRQPGLITFMELKPECFNKKNIITASLNSVKMLYAGAFEQNKTEGIELEALAMTTPKGNTYKISNPYELMMPNLETMVERFTDGDKPVIMGYLARGSFKSAFPDGIDIKEADKTETKDKNAVRHLDAVKSTKHGVVAVFSDVDFISDMLAYSDTFLGKAVQGDNSALLINTIDTLSGSTDLISIRSRGNFKRPFELIDRIEAEADKDSIAEIKKINAEITGYKTELSRMLSSLQKGQEKVIGSSILKKRKELELKIHQANRRLQQVKLQKRQRIEKLENQLKNINMLLAPGAILLIAIALASYRAIKRRRYINHNIQEQ
jgi:ABC-type uncharacterized transport system involved in gliding motility auxiliary subunit